MDASSTETRDSSTSSNVKEDATDEADVGGCCRRPAMNYAAFCRAKHVEWSARAAYPLTQKVDQLLRDPAFTGGTNFYYSFAACLQSYWQLCEALEDFEQSLRLYTQMGLLGEPVEDESEPQPRQRTTTVHDSSDFLLPTVHLGEVWGRRLAKFLKAQDDAEFRLLPEQPLQSSSAATSTTPVATVAVYRPEPAHNSGRRRLEALESIRKARFRNRGRSNAGLSWFGLILQAWPQPDSRLRVLGRALTLETYLLVAPRREHVRSGCAAFFHPGLVRLSSATKQPAAVAQSEETAAAAGQSEKANAVAAAAAAAAATTWLPEQLLDYLSAAEPDKSCALRRDVYPQLEAACAYLALALSQRLLDSSHSRFFLLRLSFLVVSTTEESCGQCGDWQPRLVDCDAVGRIFRPQLASDGGDEDACEALVLPQLLQETALVVAELLARTAGGGEDDEAEKKGTFPARRLTSLHSLKPVFDSADPDVQRSVLQRSWRQKDDGAR